MKHLAVTLLFSILMSSNLIAQGYAGTDSGFVTNLRSQAFIDQIEKIMIDSRSYELSEIEGSPYLSEDFVGAEAIIGAENMGKLPLRYNIFNEYFEIKNDDGTIGALNRLASLSLIMDGKLYVFRNYNYRNEEKSGYFTVLSNGKNATLLSKELRIFKDGIKAQSSYQKDSNPKFFEATVPFVELKKTNNLITIEKIKNKDLLEIFENNSQLQDFIRNNKLNAKNSDDLIQIIDFYNTLVL